MNWLHIVYSFRIIALLFTLFLIGLTLDYFYRSIDTKETFDLQSDSAEVITMIKSLNTSLCPALLEIQNNLKDDYEGSDQEKMAKALTSMKADAKNTLKIDELIMCPINEDPLKLPATIDILLAGSIMYVNLKIKKLLQDSENALACKETFSNPVCTPDQEAIRAKKRKEEEERQATETCLSSVEMTDDEKDQIIQARLHSLSKVLNDPKLQASLKETQESLTKLISLKNKAKSGDISPNCGS